MFKTATTLTDAQLGACSEGPFDVVARFLKLGKPGLGILPKAQESLVFCAGGSRVAGLLQQTS